MYLQESLSTLIFAFPSRPAHGTDWCSWPRWCLSGVGHWVGFHEWIQRFLNSPFYKEAGMSLVLVARGVLILSHHRLYDDSKNQKDSSTPNEYCIFFFKHFIYFRSRSHLRLDKLFDGTKCMSPLSVLTRVFLFTFIISISTQVQSDFERECWYWCGLRYLLSSQRSHPYLFLQSNIPSRGSVDIGHN